MSVCEYCAKQACGLRLNIEESINLEKRVKLAIIECPTFEPLRPGTKVIELIADFLRQREILKELRKTCASGERSFTINFETLLEFSLELAQALVENPRSVLAEFDRVLVATTKLPNIKLRVRGLLDTRQLALDKDFIKAENVGKFIEVEGFVGEVDGVRFRAREEFSYVDVQFIKIGKVLVKLEGDIAGRVKVGDFVRATGILDGFYTRPVIAYEPLLLGNHIEAIENQA